jgi:hypothetical protein
MKALVIAYLFLVNFTGFKNKAGAGVSPFTCTLTSDKKVYKVGEIPVLTVEIRNNTKKDIYLIGSLDGSDVKWRMPYCYFHIQKPKPDTITLPGRCKTLNPLRESDFMLVKPGEGFNPYQTIDGYGFFGDYTSIQAETYRNPGIYKIRFYYSSESQEFSAFGGTPSTINNDSLKIRSLFGQTQKFTIESNEIEIVFK